MAMFHGFGFAGFRSLWGEPQWIGLADGVTVVLGGNNSGKSNVLRLIHEHLSHVHAAVQSESAGLASFDLREDAPRATENVAVQVHWPLDVDSALGVHRVVADLLDVPALNRFDVPTLPLHAHNLAGRLEVAEDRSLEVFRATIDLPWRDWSSRLTGSYGGPQGADVMRLFNWLRRYAVAPPPTAFVPPSRSLKEGSSSTEDWDFGGEGVIDRLHRILNPEFDEDHLRLQAIALKRDLRRLLEDNDLEFEVPHDKSTVNIRLGGNYYPLRALGTGTEHAVLILAAHHVYPDRLLCLEEPDAHLHPRLQRRLMDLLRDGPARQVVVATHSAHLIDAAADEVLTVRLDAGRSHLDAIGDRQLFEELRRLGYRASDLLQANAVVWVEGPSDRIYLLHWLRAIDPTLVEGVDFSIAFYGGALLTRLTADTNAPSDPTLVDLWRINQRMWIVMDSDLGEGELRESVRRLQAEIETAGRGGTWITAGYTVENYVEAPLLLESVRDVHTTVRLIKSPAKNRDPLKALERANHSVLKNPDKVAIATAVTTRSANLDVHDLREQVQRLADFLRGASEDSPIGAVAGIGEPSA